jgi:protein-disulfide isomerase
MKTASAAGRPVRAPKARPAQTHRRRLCLIGGAAGVAAVLALVLVLVNRGGSSTPAPNPASLTGVAETAALLNGIPQHGTVLGSPKAPVTLAEYADLQCPICGAWATQALPTIVQKYVRTGKVRLEFRGLRFVGPDSDTALRTAIAAGAQNRLWNVVDLLYRNQGTENTGWVTDKLLRNVVVAAGLETGVLDQRASAAVNRQIAADERQAQLDAVPGTPTFEVGPTGGRLHPVQLRSLDPAELGAAIDAVGLR